MEASQLTKFKELLTAINQINGVTTPVTFFFIAKNTVTKKQGLSLYDLNKFDFLMVIGVYKWNNGSFINKSAKLLGFFNRNLELIESIPVNDKVQIKGVEFTTYPGSYYDEYKPIFICERTDGELVNLMPEDNEGWDKDFQNLYNQANEL